MRIGYLSTFDHHWNTESEIADYLDNYHTVERFQYNRFDSETFLEQDFDLVLTALPQCQPLDFWARVKALKVAWYFDLIFDWHGRERQYLSALKHFDLVISTDGFDAPYKEHGIKRVWMPHGFDARKYYPTMPDANYDVAFIGHVYTDQRRRVIQGLTKNFGLNVFGLKDNCWGEPYSRICNSAKIMFADNARNDIPGYWSDRLYLSLGSGAFLLHPKVPGIETQFEDSEHLVLWKDEADLHDKINYYLAHDDERREIAEAGCEFAHANHTIEKRVEEFNRILESVL